MKKQFNEKTFDEFISHNEQIKNVIFLKKWNFTNIDKIIFSSSYYNDIKFSIVEKSGKENSYSIRSGEISNYSFKETCSLYEESLLHAFISFGEKLYGSGILFYLNHFFKEDTFAFLKNFEIEKIIRIKENFLNKLESSSFSNTDVQNRNIKLLFSLLKKEEETVPDNKDNKNSNILITNTNKEIFSNIFFSTLTKELNTLYEVYYKSINGKKEENFLNKSILQEAINSFKIEEENIIKDISLEPGSDNILNINLKRNLKMEFFRTSKGLFKIINYSVFLPNLGEINKFKINFSFGGSTTVTAFGNEGIFAKHPNILNGNVCLGNLNYDWKIKTPSLRDFLDMIKTGNLSNAHHKVNSFFFLEDFLDENNLSCDEVIDCENFPEVFEKVNEINLSNLLKIFKLEEE